MDEAYVEQVLSLVEAIPRGRVRTYGDLAGIVDRGGPRQVGAVMARFGGSVPWWRVVRADGRPARGHEVDALTQLRSEGVPLRGDDRVDLLRARVPLGAAGVVGLSPLPQVVGVVVWSYAPEICVGAGQLAYGSRSGS